MEGNLHRKHSVSRASQARGFSLVELLIVTVVILVVLAIVTPGILRTMATYRLNSAAVNVANMLQRARYEAIKQNTIVRCRGNATTVWVDLNNNGVPDSNEPQFVLPRDIQWVNPGGSVPDSASMNLGPTQQPTGVIAFDSRGAVNFGAAGPVVYAMYVGYPNNPDYGYKAISLQPLGRTKVWGAAANGRWHSP